VLDYRDYAAFEKKLADLWAEPPKSANPRYRGLVPGRLASESREQTKAKRQQKSKDMRKRLNTWGLAGNLECGEEVVDEHA
jgi:hypothetical protein